MIWENSPSSHIVCVPRRFDDFCEWNPPDRWRQPPWWTCKCTFDDWFCCCCSSIILEEPSTEWHFAPLPSVPRGFGIVISEFREEHRRENLATAKMNASCSGNRFDSTNSRKGWLLSRLQKPYLSFEHADLFHALFTVCLTLPYIASPNKPSSFR